MQHHQSPSQLKRPHFLCFILEDLFYSFLCIFQALIVGSDTAFIQYTWRYLFTYTHFSPLLTEVFHFSFPHVSIYVTSSITFIAEETTLLIFHIGRSILQLIIYLSGLNCGQWHSFHAIHMDVFLHVYTFFPTTYISRWHVGIKDFIEKTGIRHTLNIIPSCPTRCT